MWDCFCLILHISYLVLPARMVFPCIICNFMPRSIRLWNEIRIQVESILFELPETQGHICKEAEKTVWWFSRTKNLLVLFLVIPSDSYSAQARRAKAPTIKKKSILKGNFTSNIKMYLTNGSVLFWWISCTLLWSWSLYKTRRYDGQLVLLVSRHLNYQDILKGPRQKKKICWSLHFDCIVWV